MDTLDFTKQKVQVMELSDLKRTFKENDSLGKPLRGMYHFDLIENVGNILDTMGYRMQIKEIFAAANGGGINPSVSLSDDYQKKFGDKAIEAHLLRRVYANVNVYDFDNEELSTRVAIAWHQKGIQIAYGRMVKVCHNLCIMAPKERILSTGRGIGIEQILEKFSDIMKELPGHINHDDEMISKMKNRVLTPVEILCTIGTMTTMRVAHDSLQPLIRNSEMYPLNQGQISSFTEKMLLTQKTKEHDQQQVTLWDMYNAATELLKPDKMDIPSVFDQHATLYQYVESMI